MSRPTINFNRIKKNVLESKLPHTDEWLTACYEWIITAHPGEKLTEEFIQNQIYLQWLDMDLKEMESKCLPSNLKQQRLTVLNGPIALQMNWLQDIGESAFNQYSKIKKLENENTNVQAAESTETIGTWQAKTRRCLYLSLTDGSQTVHGLEMEPIPAFSLEMNPGCKIIIYGPVDCRRGVFHLRPKHVKLLGGEVESLMASNSVENHLSKLLNKPLEPSGTQPGREVHTSHQTQPGARNHTLANVLHRSPPRPMNGPTTRNFQSQPNPTSSTDNSDQAFNSSDDELFLLDESILTQSQGSNPPVPSLPNPKAPVVITLDDEDDTSTRQASVKRPRTVTPRKKWSSSSKPYQYIKQIASGQFKPGDSILVKGTIATLTSNIQVDKTNGEWKIKVNINDGSGFIIAAIAPTVLDRIIGFSPAQMKQLKSSKSSFERDKVKLGMAQLTKTLVHFTGIMRIKIGLDENLLLEMREISNDDVHALATRTSHLASNS